MAPRLRPPWLPTMRRLGRIALVAVGLLVVAGFLWWAATLPPPPGGQSLTRREAMVGMLTLGVLCFAAFGFDLRDWL